MQEVGGVQGMKASLPIVVVTVPHEKDEKLYHFLFRRWEELRI